MAKKARDNSSWVPWGYYDYDSVGQIPDQVLSAAIAHLQIKSLAEEARLKTRLQGLAIQYWKLKRDVEKPAPKWYRQQVLSIKKATNKLLKLLKKPTKGTEHAALKQVTKVKMRRDLYAKGHLDSESITQLLESFERVCDECLRQKGSVGAKRQAHVQEVTRELAAIWMEITEKHLGLSLDTAIGRSKEEFAYPGPRFVQIVLQGIDPALSNSAIATALRSVLGKKRSATIGKPSIPKSP